MSQVEKGIGMTDSELWKFRTWAEKQPGWDVARTGVKLLDENAALHARLEEAEKKRDDIVRALGIEGLSRDLQATSAQNAKAEIHSIREGQHPTQKFLQSRVTVLEGALEHYGMHDSDCYCLNNGTDPTVQPCSCGFRAVLTPVAPKEQPTGEAPAPKYKGPIAVPCSACSDGDTAMEHHDHDYVDPKNRRERRHHERRRGERRAPYDPRYFPANLICHGPDRRRTADRRKA